MKINNCISNEIDLDRWYLVYESCERGYRAISNVFPFPLSLSQIREACLTVILFFQDPVGGLFSRKTNNFFLLKNFSEWKREKREWCIFHSSAFHRASLLSSFFPPPFPFFLSFSSLFSFFLSLSLFSPYHKYWSSICIEAYKGFFHESIRPYVRIEPRKDGGCVGREYQIRFTRWTMRTTVCIYTWNARPK